MQPAPDEPQPPWRPAADDLRSAIVDAALRELGDRELEDLLCCLTPGSLARDRAFSPSAVRYHFGREPARFDRRALAGALVDLLAERLRAQARAAADAYVAAIATVTSVDDLGVVEHALANDLQWFTPGSSGADATATDRFYLLAVAMCDSSRELSAALRAMREDVLRSYDRVYAAGLASTGRSMAPGRTLRELNVVTNAFLEGLTLLRRQHVELGLATVADAVARIFLAFTVEPERP